MLVYEKIFFEANTNDQCTSNKNNIAQLCFILHKAELHWNFPVCLRMPLIFTDFPTESGC